MKLSFIEQNNRKEEEDMKKVLIIAVSLVLVAGFCPGIEQKAMIKDAQAATQLFKFAHAQPPTHPRHKSMLFFKEKVESASQGNIKVELYPGGVLGKEAELMDMVKVGTIQGTRGGLFERANKKFLLYTLPFLFADIEQAKRLIRSSFGDRLNQGARANGFYVPATGVAGGFRQYTNNVKPILAPDDMKGLKMRTPPIDSIIRTMTALGASPQQVPYTETYMALKTKVVDGQENPCSNIAEMKFYEVQKYLTEVNYQIHPDPFYVNLAWYEGLPAALKAIFADSAKAAIMHSDEIWLASEKDYFKFLSQKLKTNSISPPNYKLFVEKVKPVWQHYVKEGYFSQGEIDEAVSTAKK
jgi:tripartite ATP-independent transporter DctP family solute receptor